MDIQPYTYLLVNFLTIFICFIASFDKRLQFNKLFGTFLFSSSIVAAPFILWDIWFTAHGVWWFDKSYTIGLTLAGLPIEEWLFFYCIPFSCIFTYFCITKFFKLDWANAFNNIIVFITIIVCSVVALLYYDRIYTLITALVTISVLIYFHFIIRIQWIGTASLIYTFLMLGFFPVNGALTGFGLQSPIVNYNPNEIIGFRLFTIPIEDAVYGYSQFLLNVYFFELLRKIKGYGN